MPRNITIEEPSGGDEAIIDYLSTDEHHGAQVKVRKVGNALEIRVETYEGRDHDLLKLRTSASPSASAPFPTASNAAPTTGRSVTSVGTKSKRDASEPPACRRLDRRQPAHNRARWAQEADMDPDKAAQWLQDNVTIAQALSVPGVVELLLEAFNNDILAAEEGGDHE